MKPRYFGICLAILISASAVRAGGAEFTISISTVSNTSPPGASISPPPAFFPADKELKMTLNSPEKPLPTAIKEVWIPVGLGMGQTVVLEPEEPEQANLKPDASPEEMKMMVYWGSGQAVKSDQPKLISWKDKPKKVSSEDSSLSWQAGSKELKAGAQIPGDYRLMSYAGNVSITLDAAQSFLPPLEVETTLENKGSGLIEISWKSIPGAGAYFVTAHGIKPDGTVIGWTSGNSPDAAKLACVDSYLSEKDTAKLIEKGILLNQETTKCTIPPGVFDGADGALIMVIAYGRDKQTKGQGVTANAVVRSTATVTREFVVDIQKLQDVPAEPFQRNSDQ